MSLIAGVDKAPRRHPNEPNRRHLLYGERLPEFSQTIEEKFGKERIQCLDLHAVWFDILLHG